MKILIIDDDKALTQSLCIQLSTQGHTTTAVNLAEEGLALLTNNPFDLILLDLTLPDMSGLQVLEKINDLNIDLTVIVISGRQDMDSTIQAIQLGAFDYIRKPLDMDAVILGIEKVKKRSTQSSEIKEPTETPAVSSREIVGNHPKMIEVLKHVGLLSRNTVNVLISGESGTGKELVARALHENTTPNDPFIPINCSALVDTLLESELFGHEKGAFTGANEAKKGKLEVAQQGTLFFDEIGEMSLNLQAKLLRVLQEREFEPVGGTRTIPFKARALFATHQNLYDMVQQGTFREDLYYRIAVAHIQLPSLSERATDIPLLSDFLLKKIASIHNTQSVTLSQDAMELLQNHVWPGNIRELENTLLRSISLSTESVLYAEHLWLNAEYSEPKGTAVSDAPSRDIFPDRFLGLSLAEVESRYIQAVLLSKEWNITHTSELLNISPTTLRKKIKDYHLQRSE